MDQESPPTQSDQASTIPQVAPPPPQPQKNNLVLWILLAVILFGTGFSAAKVLPDNLGSLLSSRPTSTPTQSIQPTPTPNPTANWKTYENSKFGFSFKYPTALTFLSDGLDQNGPLLVQDFDGSKLAGDPINNFQLVVYISKESTDKSLEQYAQQTSAKDLSDFTVGGMSAKKGVSVQKYEEVPTVWIKNGQYYFLIQLSTSKSVHAVWFDQILSTFKFSDEMTSKKSCQYNGVEYKDGENFDATDGCNKCFCSDGNVGCTLIACQE